MNQIEKDLSIELEKIRLKIEKNMPLDKLDFKIILLDQLFNEEQNENNKQ